MPAHDEDVPPAEHTARTAWAKTVLRWAGSKQRLVPLLTKLAPPEPRRYVEPFVGSGALFFALQPSQALLGDFNEGLITTLAILRAHPRRLHRALSNIPRSSSTYYEIRDRAKTTSDFEVAVRFLYLNRFCFNGLYRTNHQGHFNVPYGTRTGMFPSEAAFYRCSFALRSARLVCADYQDTLDQVLAGDFVYLDPPYSTTRSNYGEYGYGAFSDNQVPRLLEILRELDVRGATVVLSYVADSRILTGLAGWEIREILVRRQIAGQASNRSIAKEIIACNDTKSGAMIDRWLEVTSNRMKA